MSQPLTTMFNHKHSVYVEGGSDVIRFGIELRYDNQNGVMKKSLRDRIGTGLTLEYRYKGFQMQNKISYDIMTSKASPYGSFGDYTNKHPYESWEDKDGNIYSKRVGTMVQRYTESSNGWVNDATYPILYGDITKHPEYKPYMRIQVEERYALNSQGKSVPIQEVGWAAEGELPTHIVLQFTSSHGGAYIGSPGNTMWIDNVELIY